MINPGKFIYRGLSLLAMAFVVATSASAQHYWFKSVGLSDGLASSQVNHICKDKQGFLWFGTSAGLDRFDGVSIRHFESTQATSNSLPDSYIRNVQEAGNGLLWLRTNGGYVVLDPVTQTFDQSISQHLTMLGSNLDPEIVFFDKNKNLWIYDKGNAVYYYKYKQELVYKLQIGDERAGVPDGNISGFCNTTEGVLAVYTNGRVVCINGEQSRVLWTNDVIARNTTIEDEYSVFCDKEGNICVYGETHSYFYDKAQARWYTSLAQLVQEWGGGASITNELVSGISMDSKGDVWVCTDRSGMVVLRPSEHRVLAHLKAGGDRSLASNNTETVYIDDTDMVWIGTSRSGVSYYAPNIYMFDVAHIGDVYGIAEDKQGALWFATHGDGLVYRNIKDGSSVSYTTADGLNDNMLSCVLSASDGTIWAGSSRFGLNRLNGKGVTVINSISGSEKGLLDNNIQALAEDRFGNIWIGTRKGGLQCLNAKNGTFSNFNTKNQKLTSNNVTTICCKGNQLVAGTMNGIMVLNLSNNKTMTYNGTHSGDKHFTSNAITQVFIDSRGLIWVGTRDGLNVLDTSADHLFVFDKENGLPSNVICGIAEDKNHELWVTTSKGVCRIAIQDGSNSESRYSYNFYRYVESDGLQGVEFNMGAILGTRSGRIFMGGQNGINWIRNHEYKARKRTPNVILGRLFIDGQPIGVGLNYNGNVILPKMLNCLDKIVLRSSDKNIMITLGLDDYNHAEQPRYLYQVDGINDSWLPVTGDGYTLNLAYLGRGTYTLRVKAMLDGGKTVSEEHSIVIVVEGPWYTRWWFFLIVGLVLAAIAYAVYRIWPMVVDYYRRRQYEIKQLQKRQEEIDVVSQELRTQVVGMIPQLGLLMMDAKDAEVKEKLSGLQHSARQMLVSLNQLKDNQFMMVSDEGEAVSTTEIEDEDILIGDDGPVNETSNDAEFLVSDEGIISASGSFSSMSSSLRYHIFVVEPDADMLEFVSDCLKSTYTIHSFTSAEACWEAISEIRPSLIMCAENMPDLTGSELCERIKNERSYERIPFILTTDGVLTQSDIVFKHITLMADDYIPSPYNLQSVIVRINTILGLSVVKDNTMDDTLRGSIAMTNAVQAQLKFVFDQYILQNISRKDLNFEDLCQSLNISRTLFFRKVEKITGVSPTDYIRKVRLAEAAKLLESGYVSAAEAAQELGFGNLATFSRFFQTEFGVLPSQYAEGERKPKE